MEERCQVRPRVRLADTVSQLSGQACGGPEAPDGPIKAAGGGIGHAKTVQRSAQLHLETKCFERLSHSIESYGGLVELTEREKTVRRSERSQSLPILLGCLVGQVLGCVSGRDEFVQISQVRGELRLKL